MPPGAPNAALINAVFNLKMQVTTLQRNIKNAESDEKKQKKTLLKLMKGGDQEMIDSQAELVVSTQAQIREMNKTQNTLQQFIGKINKAARDVNIGASMVAVSKALDMATKNLDLAKVEQIMSELSTKYEDIDVMTSVMNSATSKATAKQVPQEEVDKLKQQIADEAGLELNQELSSVEPVKAAPAKAEVNESELRDNLRALLEQHSA